ncbi:condensation domain-containing protein [Streptacidiphilus sp. P02-A3a]|uniref:condensation domain-containing protein n=1 Tax=Streptacidiphilus sp. P02-A3a TaxID=2704468 RepID=UPI0015FCA105|nr:condensation domain-containing protein [Streptacidiphilus sp. P02-A3a]QMU67188.1 hypothetical protein GXP74_02150 [Streptacidiphilus sp. P02-A3a]
MTTATVLPLSSEQYDYLSLGRRGYGAIPVCVRLDGPLDVDLLATAAAHVAGRHQPLRMRLRPLGDGFGQVFRDPGDPVPIRMHDVVCGASALPDALDGLIAGELDLEGEGPLELHVLPLDGQGSLVVGLLDHLATDGWGSYLFNWELWRSYRALGRGQRPVLPHLARSYTDHVQDQQRVSESRSRALGRHWSTIASRFAVADNGLPATVPSQPGLGRGDLTAPIDPDHLARSRQLADALGVSANAVPLACLVLAAWSLGEGDSVGLSFIYSGRDTFSVRPLVGVFHRRVPLLVEGLRDCDVAGLLRKVTAASFDAVRRSRAPYSSRLFAGLLREHDAVSGISLLYNQIDPVFGAPRRGAVQGLSDGVTAEFVDSHFLSNRWRGYREQTLRLMVAGGERPTVQAIYNDGYVAEQQVQAMIARLAAFISALGPESAGLPLEEFIGTALQGVKDPSPVG